MNLHNEDKEEVIVSIYDVIIIDLCCDFCYVYIDGRRRYEEIPGWLWLWRKCICQIASCVISQQNQSECRMCVCQCVCVSLVCVVLFNVFEFR